MLQLKHNYFIDSDGNCLKLCKRAVRHDDEANTDREVVTLVGYYTDLTMALKSYTRHVVNEYIKDNDTTLSLVLDLLNELDEEAQCYGS